MPPSRLFLTLSFSGGGHLLPYHLGAASVLLSASMLPPIRAVSGSSSGAVAAVLFSRMPHRLQEYTEAFIATRGRAVECLQEFFYEEEQLAVRTETKGRVEQLRSSTLHIAATKCRDGSLRVFDFDAPKSLFRTISTPNQHDKIIKCVRASCSIPRSFHPVDILMSSQDVSYPDEEGIEIEGSYYVDGGIAGPAPPTPLDNHEDATRIVVSPISGNNGDDGSTRRISPLDTSVAVWKTITCRGGFGVRPSIQNLSALIGSAGLIDSSSLQRWHDRGVTDAERFVENGGRNW